MLGGIIAFVLIKVLYPGVTAEQAGDILFPGGAEREVMTS